MTFRGIIKCEWKGTGGMQCPEHPLLVTAELLSPILHTHCPDFRVGVRGLDWK